MTPAPIVITATFVGYVTFGFWGGVVATIAIFTPSFLFVIGTVPYYDRLRNWQLYQKAFQGILFSFVGLLLERHQANQGKPGVIMQGEPGIRKEKL